MLWSETAIFGDSVLAGTETRELAVERTPAGDLALSWRYRTDATHGNLYFGDLSALRSSGVYDHGYDPRCDVSTSVYGDRVESEVDLASIPSPQAYFLVTSIIDGEEGTAGFDSAQQERPAEDNVCP